MSLHTIFVARWPVWHIELPARAERRQLVAAGSALFAYCLVTPYLGYTISPLVVSTELFRGLSGYRRDDEFDSEPHPSEVFMIHRFASYAWAGPNSLLGLIAGLVMLLFGARSRLIRGTAEFSGGLIGSLFESPAIACRFHAITFGHVILGTDRAALDAARDHEQVHVRQYERWGPFFLPAYFASSLWQLLCGRRCYRDNYFEREAFKAGSLVV